MSRLKIIIGRVICAIFSLGCANSVYPANPASVDYVNQQISNLQTYVNQQAQTLQAQVTAVKNGFYVGQFYQGGVIYWLDPTASPSIHGLIADIADQSSTLQWQSNTTVTTGATLNGAYQGKNSGTFNTAKILATPGATYPAASACANSTAQGFSDWYLPSLQEVAFMFFNQMTITRTALAHSGNGFTNNSYWSSTESSTSNATYFFFNTGTQNNTTKTNANNVRCVRAF